MKINDVQKNKEKTVNVSGRVRYETKKFIKDNKIVVGKLIEEAVKELKEGIK